MSTLFSDSHLSNDDSLALQPSKQTISKVDCNSQEKENKSFFKFVQRNWDPALHERLFGKDLANVSFQNIYKSNNNSFANNTISNLAKYYQVSTSASGSFHQKKRVDNLSNVKKSLNEELSILSIINPKPQKEKFPDKIREKSYVKTGKSTDKNKDLTFIIEDLPICDIVERNNPQYVVEYVDEIYNYLQANEVSFI